MIKRILFFLATIILIGAGLYYRDQNAKSAHAQVTQILQQDTAATDTAPAVANLKTFVKSHMGASVGFTLSAAYRRAQAAAQAAANASNANGQVYAAAQAACSGKSDSITQAHCNQDYLAQHLVAVTPPAPVPEPKSTDYQYYLAAPAWTPDLPGALFLGAVVAFGMAVLSLKRPS